MGRPGAVLEVDRNTPPVLFHFGEGVRLEKLPLGSRVLYPPDPMDPIVHAERTIRRALTHPLEDDPLKALLRPGMKLAGIVTNVTAFGAFVDIGVHQDGLVHISQLANRFVKDPNDVVRVQQQVEVTVMDVDIARKRIALSMRK